MDKAEMDSILTNIRMSRVDRDVYELPAEEKERIDKVLNKTLKFVAGDLVEEDLEEEEEKLNDMEEEGKILLILNYHLTENLSVVWHDNFSAELAAILWPNLFLLVMISTITLFLFTPFSFVAMWLTS